MGHKELSIITTGFFKFSNLPTILPVRNQLCLVWQENLLKLAKCLREILSLNSLATSIKTSLRFGIPFMEDVLLIDKMLRK